MEITPTTLILVGVISLILGFLASSLLNTLRDENAEPVSEEEPAPPGGRKGHYTPVVRLWRERSKGSLVVEIDGKSLVDAAPLDEAQRERLETTARDFRAWLGMGLTTGYAPQPGSEPAQAVSPIEPVPAATTAPARSTSSTWATSGEALEVDLRRALGQELPFKPAAGKPAAVKAAAGKPVEEPKAAVIGPKSIVLQIEDILQDMLAGSSLERLDIHLTEDPARGVIVTVGNETYEGIEAVPDPEIKSAIRAAVVEWEQSQ